MQRTLKTLAATAFAAALAGTTLTGATLLAAAPAKAQVELVVQYAQPQIFDGVYAQLKETFEAENPDVRVIFRGPHKDYGTGIQALLRDAVIGDMPHVDYLGLSHLPVAAERGLLVELEPLMAAENASFEAHGWTPSLQSLGRADGKLYALPFAVSMSLVYYNADLVRQVGGDPENMPTDWDGILALAGKISDLGPDYAGMYIPYSAGWYGAWYFQGVLFGHGGEMLQPGADKVALGEDPTWQTAVDLYRRMAEEGGMLAMADQAQRQQFIAGRMGFVIDSISRLYNFETSIGDRFELGTSPHPLGAANGRLPTGGNVGAITQAAAQDPAVLDAAWRWLKFASGPYGTTQVIKLVGYTPVNVLALEDPDLLQGYFDTRPLHRTAVEQIPLVREWYQYPGENGLKIDDVIGEHLEAVVDGSMPPQEALASMTMEINRLLP